MTTAGYVYKTTDYSIFKVLIGNRKVEPRRVSRIKKSIQTVGQVIVPIVVNERMEVIDGQGRLAALSELGLPVYFVYSEGAGVAECRQLNMFQSNWTSLDHIGSYADSGDEGYIRLQKLIDTYKPAFKLNSVMGAATNTIMTSGRNASSYREGELELSEEDYMAADEALRFCLDHKKAVKGINGELRTVVSTICWIVRNTDIDKKRLAEVLDKKYVELEPVSTKALDNFLRDISSLYNWHLQPGKCIYLAEEYDRFKRIN